MYFKSKLEITVKNKPWRSESRYSGMKQSVYCNRIALLIPFLRHPFRAMTNLSFSELTLF